MPSRILTIKQKDIFPFIVLPVLEFIFAISLSGNSFIWSQRAILICICIFCLTRGIKEKNILNPYLCFILSPFSLMIYYAGVSTRYLTSLDKSVYIVSVFSFIAFLGGVHHVREKDHKQNAAVELPAYTDNGKNDKYFFIGLFFIGIWIVYQLLRITLHFYLPFSSIIKQSLYIGFVFIIMSKRRSGYIICVLISLFILIDNFRKTDFLNLFILFVLSTANNIQNRKKKIFLIIAVIIGMLLMIFIAYPLKMYNTEFGSLDNLPGFRELISFMESESKGYGSIDMSIFVLRPYLSMTTEWTNMNYALNTQPDATYGLFFLRPILNILQINTNRFTHLAIYPRSGSYNTFGFLTVQIKDFGYIGAVILTFLEGMFSGWAYCRFQKRKKSPLEAVRYTFVICAVIEMFFNNHFLLGGIHIIYLYTALLMLFIKHTDKELYYRLNAEYSDD